jgi:murein L,D-transpeptidase YcbB/YkuD
MPFAKLMSMNMKNIFFYTAILCGLMASCQSPNGNKSAGEDDSDKPESEKKVTKRDLSITKANSYSDLFIDSTVMEQFITENKLSDSIARRMRSFYNARNYQFAWFSSDGLTEQARGFWNLHDYVTTYDKDTSLNDKALQKRMAALTTEENLAVSASDKSYRNTELTLTQHFIQYMLNNFEKGYVKRKEMERFVPFKKDDPMLLADSFLTKKHKDNKYFEDVHEPYKLLKEQLGRYYNIAKQGGWQPLTASAKSLKKGTSNPVIPQIKRRLQMTGDMPGNDTSQVFNDTLEIAVRNFQERHGYKPDGVIGAAVIKEMNVPVEKRLQQILMNMNRMRWMPSEMSGNLIMVNIPEFMLHVYENNRRAFDMVVVVGKEGHNTMMFNGDLNQIVFSPYWNVPPSIVKNEIMPAMNRNPSYLSGQNMEVVSNSGGLPSIRQKPGPGNALGKVKFLFPNSFNIYFHDTPSKSLFERDMRAFSHGCIRLSDPYKMAEYLLRNEPEWTPERIRAAMDAGEEKTVRLKKAVPVVITYYTAWVDERGRLNFRDDIYQHDARLATKMFTGTMLHANTQSKGGAKTM